MQGKRFFIGFTAILAIFTMILLVTSTWAATQEKVLYSFNHNGTDGYNPQATLISDAAGNLYGTTPSGGMYNLGTVFELTRDRRAALGGWTAKVLHTFNNDGVDGSLPVGRLIFDAAGNLYGTTITGGSAGYGTVFELLPAGGGRWTEQVLHSFNLNGTDGTSPYAGLVFDAAGNLYGTTAHGGAYAWGTVFELTPTGGGGWTEQVLHSFNTVDGAYPYAGMIFDATGNLYSTTTEGGVFSNGTVFELTPAVGGGWTEEVLHSFKLGGGDGAYPSVDGLVFDAAGNLYGTTNWGGAYGYGTAFEITP